MTAFVLGLPEHKVRVIAPDVGGGFGSKIFLYAEDVCLTWASQKAQPPIKWVADRSEAFLSDAHGRDHVSHAEMAMDKDGKFLALRVHTTPTWAPTCPPLPARCPPSCTPRCWPASTARRRSMWRWMPGSPTPRRSMPTAAPAARGHLPARAPGHALRVGDGPDPDEIRRATSSPAFPYQTPVALQYDIGDYHACMDQAIKLADVAGFAAPQGRQRGQGPEARHRLQQLHRGLRHRPVNIAGAWAHAPACSNAARCACTPPAA
jgi:carbon-monoxide dehydrogenase large subunit